MVVVGTRTNNSNSAEAGSCDPAIAETDAKGSHQRIGPSTDNLRCNARDVGNDGLVVGCQASDEHS